VVTGLISCTIEPSIHGHRSNQLAHHRYITELHTTVHIGSDFCVFRSGPVINAVHFCFINAILKGTAVAQWLRRCATNRKVTGSIPDGVIGIFH